MRVLVVGLARDRGAVVAGWLAGRGARRDGGGGATRSARSTRTRPRQPAARAAPCSWSAPDWAQLSRTSCDLVVPSPGVRPDASRDAAADEAGVPVRGDSTWRVEAARRARRRGHRHQRQDDRHGARVRRCSSVPVARSAAGNIGRVAPRRGEDDRDVVVVEVSSFQLAHPTAAFAPDVAVLLQCRRGPPRLARLLRRLRAGRKRGCSPTRGPTPCWSSTATIPWSLARRRGPRRRVVRSATGAPRGGGWRRRRAGRSRRARPPRCRRRRAPHDTRQLSPPRAAAAWRSAPTSMRSPCPRRLRGLPHRAELVGKADGVLVLRRLQGHEPARHRRTRRGLRPAWCSSPGAGTRARPGGVCAASRTAAGRGRHRRGARRGRGGASPGCGAGPPGRLDGRGGARAAELARARRRGVAVPGVRVVRLVRELRGARRRLPPRGQRCSTLRVTGLTGERRRPERRTG